MEYDFIVIGGGSAGYAAAETASKLCLRVAVIEGGAQVGGLCILRGCMPSKTLIESANRHLTLRRAGEFGLSTGAISVEGGAIIERKRRLVAEFADYRRKQLENGAFDLIRGTATFVDPHTLEVTSEGGVTRLTGKTFLIATGSVFHEVELPGLTETGFLNSDAVLESTRIPESVIVLGGGAIAVEFAHYYSALGTRVTIIQRSGQLLKELDAEVGACLAQAFRHRGIEVFLKTKLLRVEKHGDRKRVYFDYDCAEKMAEAEEIIYALGRTPAVDGLGLDRAGVVAHHGRLMCDSHQSTNVPHIFAAGDAAGPHEIVHIAIQQGEIAARNAAKLVGGQDDPLGSMDYRLKLFAVFSMPEIGAVGFSEKELIEARVPYLVAQYPFDDHGKSLVMGEGEGFVKLLAAEKTREILGGVAIGPHAVDLIHEIVVAMHFRATAGDLAGVPHYHPTLSEIWLYPAEELACSGA